MLYCLMPDTNTGEHLKRGEVGEEHREVSNF